jgi:hypothetical protein
MKISIKKDYLLSFLKSPPKWFFILLGLFFLLIKLVLISSQQVFLSPETAPLDDMLMYNAAVSITEGNWLGEYNWLTLSKHQFFALWLAILHILHVPYLLGGQVLWAVASIACATAVAPALKKPWLTFSLFLLLLYNPASWANGSSYAYITRVYRDNIFPALCMLCIAGVIALALRYNSAAKSNLGWAILAGVSFTACWLTREDGWWLMPFLLVAFIITTVFILCEDGESKLQRCAVLLIPFILLYSGIAAWSAMNYFHYGRFIISDFSGLEFADAYGAMTRIQLAEEWDSNTCVPYETRRFLYDNIPEFAVLEIHLESARFHEKYNALASGAFYWALREAAANEGIYETAQEAQAYFKNLATDINALCDSGTVPAGAQRSSVSPPIDFRYVPDVLREGFYSLWFCATFQQCEPYSMRSVAPPEMLQEMEEFLHTKCLVSAIEYTDKPYYTPIQKVFFAILQTIRYTYAILLPLGIVLALIGLFATLLQFAKKRKAKSNPMDVLFWWLSIGLLLCAMLRAFMIAFVDISSFNIGNYVMYLATIHPLLIVFAFTGCVMLYNTVMASRGSQNKN